MAPAARPLWFNLAKLARPLQWAKGGFVVIGPIYALADGTSISLPAVLGAFLAFGFASSSCYVLNDIRDVEEDRAHPRKRRRPIASGAVSLGIARIFWVFLLAAAVASVGLVFLKGPVWGGVDRPLDQSLAAAMLAGAVGLYIVQTSLYSLRLKHLVILDVVSLSLGFVLRVLGGCAAALVVPSSWLLNCTFFLAMFLAFGKRLGERRAMGAAAASARMVQSVYTDEFLRMAVVVTAVATLVTYSGYVQAQADRYTFGFNLLWLTVLPATYGLLRCIVLVERGEYDDPTELAIHDRAFQAAVGLFGLLMLALVWGLPLIGKSVIRG